MEEAIKAKLVKYATDGMVVLFIGQLAPPRTAEGQQRYQDVEGKVIKAMFRLAMEGMDLGVIMAEAEREADAMVAATLAEIAIEKAKG